MSVSRMKRLNELLRREIGSALFRIIKHDDFDLSAVTITRVITTKDLRQARVFVSIRNNEDRRGSMMSILRKHRKEIQQIINTNLVMKYTPRLSFDLDSSIEKGDKVLGILAKIEGEELETQEQTKDNDEQAKENEENA